MGMFAADETGPMGLAASRDGLYGDVDLRLRSLMKAMQEGDQDACRTLLRLCIPWIERAARRRGIPSEAIDDVVQNVLIAVHYGRHHCDPSRPFLPWLRAIARNRSIDWLRQSRHRIAREVHAPEAVENCADPGAFDAIESTPRFLHDEINASMECLSPGQRRAVRLLVLDDLTLDQASTQSGIKKVALKVSLHRALKALRRRWQDDQS